VTRIDRRFAEEARQKAPRLSVPEAILSGVQSAAKA
jgi:hypothetical protein